MWNLDCGTISRSQMFGMATQSVHICQIATIKSSTAYIKIKFKLKTLNACVYLDNNDYLSIVFSFHSFDSVAGSVCARVFVAWIDWPWSLNWMTGGVGKSSLVLRFIKGTFRESYIPTIEDTYRQVSFYRMSLLYITIVESFPNKLLFQTPTFFKVVFLFFFIFIFIL